MFKLNVILFFFCFGTYANAQEKSAVDLKKAELGATLFTINSFEKYNDLGNSQFEYINGLFFRYQISRFALRSQVSYSKNSYPNYFETELLDGLYHSDFKAHLGLQYSLLKNKNWLYAFIDFGYRSIIEKTYFISDAPDYRYITTTKQEGLSNYFGLGSRVTFLKSICLSPELAIDFYAANSSASSYSLYSHVTYLSNNNIYKAQPVFKLHLTVKF